MDLPRPPWFDPALAALFAGDDLPSGLAAAAFRDVLHGRVDDTLATALVVALRMKGESAAEVAAAARGLREQMIRLVPVSGPVLDTCGTGGDDSGTFNISTAAALVVAGAGVPVVKHGNRAVSSRSGSADVLRELGVPIENGPGWAQRCLDRIGFAFCYAPHFHRGMANVANLRRKLGVRTVFNLLGPLANPASADYQLIGVGNPDLLDVLAAALAELGTRRAILVCGFDGLDEVSLATPTMVRIVEGDNFYNDEWDRDDFGLEAVTADQIRAADAAESAAVIRRVLDGESGPARRMVLANAAAALVAAGAVANPHDGVLVAESSIDSGSAKSVLERLTAGIVVGPPVPGRTRSARPAGGTRPFKHLLRRGRRFGGGGRCRGDRRSRTLRLRRSLTVRLRRGGWPVHLRPVHLRLVHLRLVRLRLVRFGRAAAGALRGEQGGHLLPFHPRRRLHLAHVGQLLDHGVHDPPPFLDVLKFPPAELHLDLHLVPGLQELAGLVHAGVHVVLAGLRPHAEFLQLLLVRLLVRLLTLGVLVLPPVHDLAHGGPLLGGDLHQVHAGLAGHVLGLGGGHDAVLLPFRPDEADGRDADLLIQAGAGRRTGRAVAVERGDTRTPGVREVFPGLAIQADWGSKPNFTQVSHRGAFVNGTRRKIKWNPRAATARERVVPSRSLAVAARGNAPTPGCTNPRRTPR